MTKRQNNKITSFECSCDHNDDHDGPVGECESEFFRGLQIFECR